MGAVIKRYAKDDDIGDALFQPMVMAEMAGGLMVKGREAEQVRLALGDGQDAQAFMNMPWEEALEEYRRRGVVKPDELRRLISDYADRSVEARQLMLERVQERVREMLATAIEEGQSLGQFAESLEGEAQGLGITAEDPAYLQTVFRTNVQSAYGAGRFRAMQDPDVVEARPFVQYRTVGDARVRPAHAELDGKTFRIDSDEWKRIAPPNGYNCRCSMVTLDEYDGEVSTTIPDDALPDEGFDGPPVDTVGRKLT